MNWIVSFLLIGAVSICRGQIPLTDKAALLAIYGSHFNPDTGKAIWHCPEDSSAEPDGCAFVGDSTVTPMVLLSAKVNQDDVLTTFVVTSVAEKMDCHACTPMIGFGVFYYEKGKWIAESVNPSVDRFGAWGKPPDVTLVELGTNIYGAMLTVYDGGQGYMATSANLIAARDKSASIVWSGILDEDNSGDYDPTGKDGSTERVHVDAAYCFVATQDQKYFDLEIISRGRGYGGEGKLVSRSENDIYRFKDGKYQILKRNRYRELPARKH